MSSLQQIINSQDAPNTIIMMTAADLQKLIEETNAYTRRCVEAQYEVKFYDSADLQRLFKIGRTTLYKWEREGHLPACIQPEGSDKKLWNKAEIHEWLDSGKAGRYKRK